MRMIIGVLIGLAVGTLFYFYQNPDVAPKTSEDLTGRAGLSNDSVGAVPESFAAVEATKAPVSANRPVVVNIHKSSSQSEVEAIAEKKPDRRVLELEKQVHKEINLARFENGSSGGLRWDDRLADVARAHSEDMVRRGYFAHKTPEGLGPTERLTKAGHSCTKRTHYGLAENLAIQPDLRSIDKMAAGAVESWMNSEGHRTNLLSSQYGRTGIGAAFGRWKGQKSVYLTQVFC